MKAAQIACLLFLALLSGASHPAELGFTVDAREVYDSNFFGRENTDDPANSMELGGRIDLRDRDGRFRYDARYAGVYQRFWDQDDADAFESRLRLRAEYDIDRSSSFLLTNRFRDVSNLQFTADDITLGDTGLNAQQSRYLRNDLEGLWTRDLSETFRVWFAGRNGLIDFEDNERRSDSVSWEAEAGMSFLVARNHRVGGSVSYVREDFDMAGARFGSTGEYVTTKLSWEVELSESGRFTVQAGPAWIRSDEDPLARVSDTRYVGVELGDETLRANFDSCGIDPLVGVPVESRCDFAALNAPPIPADSLGPKTTFVVDPPAEGLSDDDVVVFGSVGLAIGDGAWKVDLNATRQQNTTFGDSGASVLNRLSWRLDYAPVRRWSAYFAGSLERRDSPIEASQIDFVVVPGDDNAAERNAPIVEIRNRDDRRDAVTLVLGLLSDVGPSTSLTFEVRYRELEREAGDVTNTGDHYFVVLGLSHRFTPIRF